MFFGILIAVLIIAGIGLYIMMPKTPKITENIESVSDLEAYLESVVAAERPPGLSVAVVKDGQMIYANGFGVADGPQNIPAMQDTVYHWWSMTKIPTAVAVMQLHERGQLNIDDPISDYLPFFKGSFKGVDQPQITIRQVLNHSAGLSNAVPELITWLHLEGEPSFNQTELVLEKFPDYNGLLFLPGEESHYSNFGYMVLGALIEAVSGQSYEEYVGENILIPTGMQNTNFVYTEAMAEHEATGSQHLIDMYTPFFPLYKLNFMVRERVGTRLWLQRVYNDQTPPTGLIGSVTDVGHFMIAYLNNGDSLLQPETISLMNEVTENLSPANDNAMGLGWHANLSADGRRSMGHSGGGPGFATIFRVYPDENLGIAIMANDSTIDREKLADILANFEW